MGCCRFLVLSCDFVLRINFRASGFISISFGAMLISLFVKSLFEGYCFKVEEGCSPFKLPGSLLPAAESDDVGEGCKEGNDTLLDIIA